MKRLYDAAYLSAVTLTLPYWLYQSVRTGKYRRGLTDRLLGRVPPADQARSRVWFHAVSLGEVLSILPLIQLFQTQRPDLQVILSTSTDTGLEVAKKRLPDLSVFRAPLDFSWAMRRTLHNVSPSLIVLAEGELWPNLLLEAQHRRIPVCVVNARVSARSFRGYQRLGGLVKQALQSVRWWGAQSEEYAQRIKALVGDEAGAITVTGSLKFDGANTDRHHPRVHALRSLLNVQESDRILIAGSTLAPEEESVLSTWRQLLRIDPAIRLFLVPRHPERFDEVASLLRRENVPFVRRSEITAETKTRAPVVLVDSVGELAPLWGLATWGFVGGSMTKKRGGQSMIEPAALGIPCCFGPSTANFRSVVNQLLAHQAACQVQNGAELTAILASWVRHPHEAQALGRRAREVVLQQQGAVRRTADALAPFIPLPWRERASA